MKKLVSLLLVVLMLLPILPAFAEDEDVSIASSFEQNPALTEDPVCTEAEDSGLNEKATKYPFIFLDSPDLLSGTYVAKRGETIVFPLKGIRGDFSTIKCQCRIRRYGESTYFSGAEHQFTSATFSWSVSFDTTPYGAGRYVMESDIYAYYGGSWVHINNQYDTIDSCYFYIAEAFNGNVEWNANEVQFKGKTPYVVYNKGIQTPGFVVKQSNGTVVSSSYYSATYSDNIKPGTAYLNLTFSGIYYGSLKVPFKIFLPGPQTTTVKNVDDGIKVSWSAVDDAKGYVIYRRAWNLQDAGWTTFERWNNTTKTSWTDTKVYAGTRYQYGIKAYYSDPMDNYNLGVVGPLKTTVRITTRTLNAVTPGSKQLTAKWSGSSVFTGYQLQYATNADFNGLKTVTIANNKAYQTTVQNLNSGTTYYVRVRSYHVFEGTTYYGGWSNVLSCKVR
jgi:hypothetical protein